LHHAGFEKAVDELKEAAISYPFGQQVEQSGLMDTIECRADIPLYDGSIRCFLHPIGSLYNREKLINHPIGKASPWDKLRLSR
jgi:hypothetical protein